MTEEKKSVLTIRVPRGLKARIEKYSVLEGVSINQFALYAFAKEIGQLESNQYFRERLRGRKKEEVVAAFDAVMATVPDRRPPRWDEQQGKVRGAIAPLKAHATASRRPGSAGPAHGQGAGRRTPSRSRSGR